MNTDEKPLLPRTVMLLGARMTPLARAVDARLNEAPASTVRKVPPQHLLEAVSAQMKSFSLRVEQIDPILAAVNDAVSDPAATDADVRVAIDRLDAWVDAAIVLHRSALSMTTTGDDCVVLGWVEATHRHLLVQVRRWLHASSQAIADPRAELVRRGIPLEGKVELDLSLKLTPAAELVELRHWLEERRAQEQERKLSSALLSWVVVLWAATR